MLTYDTGVRNGQPISQNLQQQALAGLLSGGASLPTIGPAHDVYNAAAQNAAVDYERAAAAANNQYSANAQQSQNEMALQGAQQMAQAQQNQNDLDARRRALTFGYTGQMMGGLNGLLRDAF